MSELFNTLGELVVVLWKLLQEIVVLGLSWSLLLVWIAWWLGAVNWKKTWAVLAEGAWVPLVLLIVASALVWSQIAPSDLPLFGSITVPNFWWQLGGAGLFAASALFCGWLQGVFGWTPAEINLEPPAPSAHEHDHGHGHGH